MRRLHLVLLAVALAAGLAPRPATANHQLPARRLVVLIMDYLVDPSQLRFGAANPPLCGFIHLGALSGGMVTTLNGMVIADPAPSGCHFGIWGQVPVGIVFEIDPLFDNDRDGISNFFEQELGLDLNHPDSDRDGILDGAEDTDGDGLSNEDEIYRAHTDPTTKDSDQDGILDPFDSLLEQTAKEFVVIPVLINILTRPGGQPATTTQHATQAVERANVVLQQAKIRLVPVQIQLNAAGNGGDDGTGGAEASDGNIDSQVDASGNSEFRRALDEGAKEITDLEGYGGVGMKVTFAFDADPRFGGPGASLRGQPTVVVEQRETVDLTAATIVHELGHVFGIDEHPIQTEETTPEDSPGNFMNPSVNGPGNRQGRDDFVKENGLEKVEITADQVAQIESTGFAELFGLAGEAQSPAVKSPVHRGYALDRLGDQGAAPRYLDLSGVQLVSRPEDESIQVRIQLADVLPAVNPFAASYRLLIDADADESTGSAVVGFQGIDRQVNVSVQRDATAGFLFGALVFDSVNQRLSGVVPHPTTETTRFVLENAAPQVVGSSIVLALRKDLLLLGAADVPIALLAIDGGNVLRDTATVSYRQHVDEGFPTLTLFQEFVDPEATVPFAITGLVPFTDFELEVDGSSVLSASADGSGAFAGSFVFPAAARPGAHFVVASPADGAIAYGLLRVAEPLPAAADDGTFEKGYGFTAAAAGAEFVMRIDPPSGRHRLEEASVCWTRSGTSSDASIDFDLNVYAVAQDGKPGALLGALPGVAAYGVPVFPSKRFYSYDLTDLGIETSGPLFVGPSWNPAVEQGMFVCADETSALQPGFFSSVGGAPVTAIQDAPAFQGYRALGVRAAFARLAGPCVPDPSTACLLGGRYEVRAHQNDFSNPVGQGKVFVSIVQHYPQITSETELSVSFYSFQDGNVEFFVKMNNACQGFPAGHPLRADWLWVTGATTAESAIEVTDTFTGEQRMIANPKGRPFELFLDTRAFTACDAAPAGACTSDATTACLLDRYRVRGRQYDFSNPAGQGALRTSVVQRYPSGSSATDQSVNFYSFEDGNVEFFVKMNNACQGFPAGHPLRADWLWVTGATTAESRVTVTDTRTLQRRTIVNPKSDPFALFLDTRAFQDCDAPPVP